MDGQRGFLTKQANVWAKHSPEGVGEERFPSRDYLSKNVNAPVKNHWANVFMIAIQHQFKKQKRSSYWPPPTVVLVNIIFPGLLWVTRFNQPPPPPPGHRAASVSCKEQRLLCTRVLTARKPHADHNGPIDNGGKSTETWHMLRILLGPGQNSVPAALGACVCSKVKLI